MSEQSSTTWLAGKMHALADSGHPRADELRKLAGDFELASAGFFAADPAFNASAFMGTWARARRLWSECSGEPLL